MLPEPEQEQHLLMKVLPAPLHPLFLPSLCAWTLQEYLQLVVGDRGVHEGGGAGPCALFRVQHVLRKVLNVGILL